MTDNGIKVTLRKEDLVVLELISKHRMMTPKVLAQDILWLGILAECEKLKAVYGDKWKEKISQSKKEANYE